MVDLVDGVFGVGVLAGLALCLLGYHTYRQFDELGVTPFAAFAVVLGLGGVVGGLLGVAGIGSDSAPAPWTQAAIVLWAVSAFPWLLFAVRYTGRYVRLRRRTLVLALLPYLGLLPPVAFIILDVDGLAVAGAVSSLVFIYCLALALVGIYLVVRTTYAYGQFSIRQGVTLSVAPLGTLLVLNSLGVVQQASELAAAVLFALMFTVAALTVAVAVTRQEVFAASPAVGPLGERTVVRETDDLVLVVDDRDRVIRLNETALDTLDVRRSEALAADLPGLLGHDTETLEERETVALDTADGTRQYDPQVSALTARGHRIGSVLSLRDVTERQLREQRLSVLNRVLRHNLRNKVEVLKSRTEVLDAGLDGDHAEHTATLTETADEIAELGRNARQIDQFVAAETAETTVDVVAAVSEVLAAVDADGTDVDVAVEAPSSLRVETNRLALTAALESALDNAVEYADSTVTVTVERESDGCLIRVVDDGPGIPEGELESLDSGVETPLEHTTGLGLWQLRWAVTTLGGDLSFDTTDGTTVEMVVPHRGRRDDAAVSVH